MKVKHPPFYHRILFRLLVPVVAAGVAAATLLVNHLSAPLESFLISQFDANLQLAADLGVRDCEESMNDLLELRLETDPEMARVMQNETIDRILALSEQFPHIHLMVIQSDNDIKGSSIEVSPEGWDSSITGARGDTPLAVTLNGRPASARVQFFPFWDWHIVSFVFEQDYKQPVISAYRITYLSAAGVFLVVLVTLILVFHFLIKAPLGNLIRATDDVGEGRLRKLERIEKTELGRLYTSFNTMVESLGNEKAAVDELIRQLKESEGLFRSQFEYGNIGIAVSAIEQGWARVNSRCSSILGYTEQELQEMDWQALTHPDDLGRELPRYHRMVAGDIENYDIEKRVIHKSGRIVFAHVSVSCFRNPDQSVRYLIVSILDITRSREAAEELKRNASFIRALLTAVPAPVFYKDRNGRYQGCNQAFSDIMGVSADDIRGKTVKELWPGPQADIYHRMDLELIHHPRHQVYESEVVTRSGETRSVIFAKDVFRDEKGEIAGIIGAFTDITDRKQAEDEVRNLRNYLSNIIDSMPSIIIGVDRDGRVTQWNSMAEQDTGIPSDAAAGQPLEAVFPRLAGHSGQVSRAIRKLAVCADIRQTSEKDGQTVYENLTIYPLMATGTEGAVIRLDDITEKVRLEEMMVQSEKMLSVGGLAAGMAHEINNPLAGMIQNANVLRSRLEDLDLRANQRAAQAVGVPMEHIRSFMEKRQIFDMVDAINTSGRRVTGIINNMLSFARKGDAKRSAHYPPDLLDQILDLAATDYDMKKQYDFKTIRIVREYEPDLPEIPCEGAKIQQVLLNILRNGAQAMQTRGTAGQAPPRFILRISVEKAAHMLRIEIEDNGPGMDQDTRRRIFEPFFTTKEPGVGTGLGLSVSYFIIRENHGGTMTVVSSPGKGANFIIRLPLED